MTQLSTAGLLRFATAGSVDDGKSTLIGRLLYDSKSIFEDQYEAVEHASARRGLETPNLALLTDGLRAERDQGITIDVAYRYFATPKRKFIIADTPGHVQYTRNMVTGASTADVAVILVDARQGMVEQSRRHATIATLLGIPHLVVCINKMDLVHWEKAVFDRIRDDFMSFATRLDATDTTFIPMSALHGDNVVVGSDWMSWYEGPTLLGYLEDLEVARTETAGGGRFPVQYVIRPQTDEHHDYRGYAGQVAGGGFRVGDRVVVLPAAIETTISGIDVLDGPLDEAIAPMSVTMHLADDIDVSRGDLIAPVDALPRVERELDAMVCWFDVNPLTVGGRYAIKQTTRSAKAAVDEISFRLDVNSLREHEAVDGLAMNEIGRIKLRTSSPLVFDPYRENRITGSFILIDEATNATAGAGMIL